MNAQNESTVRSSHSDGGGSTANTISRRSFLAAAGGTAAFLSLGPGVTAAMASPYKTGNSDSGAQTGGDTVLVTVFLRGAADGLNIVVPFNDPEYYAKRTRTDPDTNEVLGSIVVETAGMPQLSDDFKLHPSAGGLQTLYESGDLAIVHAAGSDDAARSHFRAMDNMDYAFGSTGWLRGGLGGASLTAAHHGLTVGASPSPSLESAEGSAAALGSVGDFQDTRVFDPQRRELLTELYSGDTYSLGAGAPGVADPDMAAPVALGFSVLDVINSIPTTPPENGANYAEASIGGGLANAAQMIKADVGCRAITVDFGGWDHHSDEMNRLPGLVAELSQSLKAFKEDLGDDWERTVVVVMSEFGRTAAINGADGTDHGHGNVMFLLGGQVFGGRVYLRGGWPGLATENLYQGQDLWITTDFRDVFAEVLRHQFGLPAVFAALPDYSPSYLNIMGSPPQASDASVPKFFNHSRRQNGELAVFWAAADEARGPGWAVGSVIEGYSKASRSWHPLLQTSDTSAKGRVLLSPDQVTPDALRVAWKISGGGQTGWSDRYDLRSSLPTKVDVTGR